MWRVREELRWTEAAVIGALRDWAQRYGEAPTAVDWDRSSAYRQGGAARVARLAEHPTPVPSVSTVLARFGSWKAAVAAAGLRPRSEARRLDADQLRETVALYESGLPTVEVAARLGIAPKTVRDRLHGAGVALRPAPPRATRSPDAELDAAVLAASRERATQRQIADRLGVSTHQVREILTRHDLTGGPVTRQLRTQLARLEELELTARQRDVIELVVAQRRTHADAAQQLGISPSTIADNLKAASIRLQQAVA